MWAVAISLPPFAMWTAFPSSDYYGGSAPCRAHRATVALPAGPRAADRVGQARQGSHVHCVTLSGVGVQLCSDSIATSTPQAFLVACRTGVNNRLGSRLPVRPFGAHCIPAHIRQIGAGSTVTEVQPLVHSRYTFPPRSPDPTHLAVLGPSRLCQGCFPPSPAPPGSGCPQLQPSRCDDQAMEVSHPHPYTQRLMAHLDDMEGVEDRDGVLELVIDRVLVPVERVQGRDLHAPTEALTAFSEPVGVGLARPAGTRSSSRARTRPCWSRVRSTIPVSSLGPRPPSSTAWSRRGARCAHRRPRTRRSRTSTGRRPWPRAAA